MPAGLISGVAQVSGGHTRDDPCRHGVEWKCATDQAQGPGVKRMLAHTQAFLIHILGQQNWGSGGVRLEH